MELKLDSVRDFAGHICIYSSISHGTQVPMKENCQQCNMFMMNKTQFFMWLKMIVWTVCWPKLLKWAPRYRELRQMFLLWRRWATTTVELKKSVAAMQERWAEAKTYVVNLKKASKRLHSNGDTNCKQTEVMWDWIQALKNHNKRNDMRWKRPLALTCKQIIFLHFFQEVNMVTGDTDRQIILAAGDESHFWTKEGLRICWDFIMDLWRLIKPCERESTVHPILPVTDPILELIIF